MAKLLPATWKALGSVPAMKTITDSPPNSGWRAGGLAQLVRCLPRNCVDPSSIPRTLVKILVGVVHICNPSTGGRQRR